MNPDGTARRQVTFTPNTAEVMNDWRNTCITGTELNDVSYGTSGNDVICALAGNDTSTARPATTPSTAVSVTT
jgi:hypothetical protein